MYLLGIERKRDICRKQGKESGEVGKRERNREEREQQKGAARTISLKQREQGKE